MQRIEKYRPPPPEGMGPPLVWFQETSRHKIYMLLIGLAILTIGMSLISLLRGDGFGQSLGYWQIWIIILIGSLLIASPATTKYQSAGADWYQWGHTRWYTFRRRTYHILMYDIVKAEAWGTGAAKIFLTLTDRHGNTCTKMQIDLQRHRQIWNLLYNGIAHSVANGAHVNKMSLNILELAKTPALRIRVAKEENGEPLPNKPDMRQRSK